jgi:putative redox protein
MSVVVVQGGGASLAQEIWAGQHHLVVDESVADGGTDAGPNPYDMLLAALGG